MNRNSTDISQYQQIDRYNLISHSLEQTINQLRQWRLLLSPHEFKCTNYDCSSFQGQLKSYVDIRNPEEVRFICYTCNKKKVIKYDSIFYGLRVPLVSIFRLVFNCFCSNKSVKAAQLECNIFKRQTIVYYQYLKTVISDHHEEETRNLMLGTVPKVEFCTETQDHLLSPAVECDESLFTHLANVKGKYESQVWVIGIFDRGTSFSKCFVVGTERSTQKILEIFAANVYTNPNQKTRVYTDQYRIYPELKGHDYDHIPINHSQDFGSGINTTNHKESLWSQIKSSSGFNKGLNFNRLNDVQLSLNVSMWRIKKRYQDIPDKLVQILRVQNRKIG